MNDPGAKTRRHWEQNPVLQKLVSRHRGKIALLAAFSFAGALLEAFFLVLVTAVALALVSGRPTIGPLLGQTLPVGWSLAIGAGVLSARLALSLVGVRISALLTAVVTTEQRTRLTRSYLQTSWALQQADPAGRLQALLTGFVGAASGAVMTLTSAVTALLSLTAFLITGLVVDPFATIAVAASLATVGALLAPIRRRIKQRSAFSAHAGLEFANAVSELGSLGLEMQAFGVKDRFARRIEALSAKTVETQRKVQTLSGSLSPVYMALSYAAILAGVAILTVVGVDNLPVIGAVMLLMLRSLSYGQQVAAASGNLAGNIPYLESLKETVERYDASPASTGRVIPASVTPLEAVAMGFEYEPGRRALSDVSFQIRGGEVIGVIGPSGAGKSTLAQLLLGLREPTAGALLVAGTELRDVDRAWWARHVSLVAQDALLFTGTVEENIRFFREGIGDADLRHAARQANVLTDIEALPLGFATHLGERGSQLSGGQRQRLSIARALVGKPKLLILDEPTSALDGRSEALIRDSLESLKGEVTTVIIAHRMSTLDMCDRLMVIEGGQMTAFDTPLALQAESTFYQKALALSGIAATGEATP